MKYIKKYNLFEEHLPDMSWFDMELPTFKRWWIDLDESKQRELIEKYYSDKCRNKIKYYPSDKEIKNICDNENTTKEGKIFNDVRSGLYPKKSWDPNKKRDFRDKIKNHVKSKGFETKQVGNDLEIICDDKMIAQVMFRDNYVGVRKNGNKFTDEFEYTELGKIKLKISEITKNCE